MPGYQYTAVALFDGFVDTCLPWVYKEEVNILNEKKDVLISGAWLLLEKEKIDGEEIRALL